MAHNRAQRRVLKHNAKAAAAQLARRCYDYRAGGGMAPVIHPGAVAALTRAFTLLLHRCGEPVAVPIAKVEAEGFPRWPDDVAPVGVTWLAVGVDMEGRASYALQSAANPSLDLAHEAARAKALAELERVCATRGFPDWARHGPGLRYPRRRCP